MDTIKVSALRWAPPFAQGLVRDLRVRWALEEAGLLTDDERAPHSAHHGSRRQAADARRLSLARRGTTRVSQGALGTKSYLRGERPACARELRARFCANFRSKSTVAARTDCVGNLAR